MASLERQGQEGIREDRIVGWVEGNNMGKEAVEIVMDEVVAAGFAD